MIRQIAKLKSLSIFPLIRYIRIQLGAWNRHRHADTHVCAHTHAHTHKLLAYAFAIIANKLDCCVNKNMYIITTGYTMNTE